MLSLVGYGDISPETGLGKFIGLFTACSGVIVMSLPIPIIAQVSLNTLLCKGDSLKILLLFQNFEAFHMETNRKNRLRHVKKRSFQ